MTSDWSDGYQIDVGYTYGYYRELNPLRARLALLNAGFALPKQAVACELGFGQGLSVNIHAAASATHWYGTDFNPAQAGFAQELAAESGSNVALYDDAFAEFCNRSDLPDFDYIGLHGIWSWISDDNRVLLVDFIRRKLKVGGVLYISYNTMPGRAAFSPLRHLMSLHADLFGAKGHGVISSVEGAIKFVEKLISVNPSYFHANPQVIDIFNKMKVLSPNYLAHEYFNLDWHPMHFATMATLLQPAKLQFACSAHYIDLIAAVNVSSEQLALLSDIPDGTFRESVLDFMTNQQFRKDYWVKGARKISTIEQLETLRNERVVLVSNREDISLKITGLVKEANMNAAVYLPILDLLSDHKIRTIGQIELVAKDHSISFPQLMQAILVLTANNHLATAQEESVIIESKKHTDRLNAHILSKARSSSDLLFLASPVTGGGIPIARFQQLFMIAISQGKNSPQEWAKFGWEILSQQGQRIMRDGKLIESADENLAELEDQARLFSGSRLSMLTALHVL